MTTWTYTKKLRMEAKSIKVVAAFQEHGKPLLDWYYTRGEAGLAPSTQVMPWKILPDSNGVLLVTEILLVNQTEVDAYLLQERSFHEILNTGFPPSDATVIDVDYPIDSISSDEWVLGPGWSMTPAQWNLIDYIISQDV